MLIQPQPLTADQKRIVEDFTREMREKVIPEIVETIHRRQARAAETQHRVIRTL